MGGAGTLTISTRREGDWIVVGIADTGPGIPPEVLPRIFEPFFTTSNVPLYVCGPPLSISSKLMTSLITKDRSTPQAVCWNHR